MHRISAVVLAGGRSRRLGQDKAFIEIAGKPLIERVLQAIAPLSDDLVIVANQPEAYDYLRVRVIGDIYPGKAALGGIYSGLLVAQHAQAFVLGCDMPFLNPALLQYMIALAPGHPIVIPCYDGHLEPLHAIYHKMCLEPMAKLIAANQLQIANVLRHAPIRYIGPEELDRFDPDRLSFFNINTPQDLERAEELAPALDVARTGRTCVP